MSILIFSQPNNEKHFVFIKLFKACAVDDFIVIFLHEHQSGVLQSFAVVLVGVSENESDCAHYDKMVRDVKQRENMGLKNC